MPAIERVVYDKPNIIDKLLKRFGYIKENQSNVSVNSITGNYMFNQSQGISQQTSYSTLVNNYKYWVYTCIDKIATTIAAMPLNLYYYKKGGTKIKGLTIKSYLRKIKNNREREIYLKENNVEKVLVDNHPFLDLLNNPNRIMTRFALWKHIVIRLELAGYCGVYMPPNGLGIPGELWPLPLTSTGILKVVPDPKKVIKGYVYSDGTKTTRFDIDEISYLCYPNPKNPFQGQSALMAQDYPYDIDLYLMRQQYGFLKNKAQLGNVFTTDQKLNKTEVDELKDQMSEQYDGALNAGKAIMTHSGLKLDNRGLSQTTKDMMLEQTEKYAREKLFASFNLSAGKLGMIDDVNRNNLEGLDKAFIQDCIVPKTMMIEEYFEKNTLPKYDDSLTMDFDTPDITERELDIKERESDLKNGYKTINEIRAENGLDKVPWGNEPWFPISMTQPSVSEIEREGEEKVYRKKSFRVGIKLLTPDYWTTERKQKSNDEFKKNTEAYEKLFIPMLDKMFDRQRRETIKRLEKEGKIVAGYINGWSKSKIRRWTKDNNDKIQKININKTEEAAILAEESTPIFKEVLTSSGDKILDTLGIGVAFAVDDPAVEKWLGERLKEYSKDVSKTTYDKIAAILREGFNEGLPLTTIGDNISETFKNFKTYRSNMIARTESISASNRAEVEAIEQQELDKKLNKFWISEVDARDTHAQAAIDYNESNAIPINKDFIVGGDRMKHPGGGVKPEENINCRCNMGYTEK